MRVVHVNVYDIKGGAARAAYRLHKGLISRAVESRFYVQEKFGQDQSVIEYKREEIFYERWFFRLRQQKLKRAFSRYEKSRQNGMELFTDARSLFASRPLRQLPCADLINLHWIARYIDVADLATHTTAPIVWTLHDMNAFTGGCHYSDGCVRYMAGCGKCPQLGSVLEDDLSRQNYKHKERSYAAISPGRLQIVTPSRWLAQLAKNSPLLGRFPVTVIPNGIDPTMFVPQDKMGARRSLQIPEAAKVIMFIADSLGSKRKGFASLLAVLRDLQPHGSLLLLAVGKGSVPLSNSENLLCLGEIDNDAHLASLLAAADVFVIPSLEDNFPNTVLEAMASGVPVAGFAAGGIPEMVLENKSGLLAPVGDIQGLRQAIVELCDNNGLRQELSQNARLAAVNKYAVELQVERYLDIYRSMLS